jgi:glyoxylase-like metal-dependent hydrolase (beta-lactamase superfamily II)
MAEVSMNIRSITAPNPGPFTLDGTRTYLIGDTTVIDPGPAIDSHVRAIVDAMPHLKTILLTHRHGDHAPAAALLKAKTAAHLFAPPGAATDADRIVEHGDVVDGLEAIATPGHTREHVCYITAEGDLFTGDTILGSGTTAIFPPDGHMGDYLRSLHLLRSRNPRRIYPGHGPTRDDAVTLIDEYIAHRLEREEQVLESLITGAKSSAEIRSQIYVDLDERLQRAAENQVEAHLIKLREEGRVDEDGGVYRLADPR